MKAKSKPLATKTPDELGVDIARRLETLKVVEPAKRQAGRQGRLGRRAGRQTESAGSGEMKTLVLVEHDGKAVKDATLAAVTAAAKLGEVHLLVAGKDVGAGRRGGRQDRRRRQGPCRRRRASRASAGRGCRAARRAADGRPRRLPRARHHHRQEHRAARRRLARRDADFRHPLGRGRETRSPGRSTPATPSPRSARRTPRRSSRCAARRSRKPRATAAREPSRRSTPGRTTPSRSSSPRKCRRASGPS